MEKGEKMNAYEKIEMLDEKEFKRIIGVTREVFEKMLKVLREKYGEDHKRGGQRGMAVELRLTLALEYWREYRTYDHMANDHQIGKSEINRAVMWVEDTISGSEEFKIKDLKERFKPEESNISIIVVDVEEQPVERPKHNQEEAYSGKKTAYNKISNRNLC